MAEIWNSIWTYQGSRLLSIPFLLPSYCSIAVVVVDAEDVCVVLCCFLLFYQLTLWCACYSFFISAVWVSLWKSFA